MRHSLASVGLLAALAATACFDNTPTTPLHGPGVNGPRLTLTPAQEIDQLILELFPTGLETATGARWETVKQKKAAGDIPGATKAYLSLADWIKKKTSDVQAPAGETKDHAATRLVYAMSLWLFVGPDTPLPTPGADSKFALVPAGTAAAVVTDSKKAGVDIDAGSTGEDRVILVVEDEQRYDVQCQGPLDTPRCQVPLFYKFESFPHKALIKPARFAVCMATIGKRRPLDYVDPARGSLHQVHQRLALAHDAPASPADRTPGSTIEGNIEILPLVPIVQQTRVTECEQDIDYLPTIGTVGSGWRGTGQRLLLAAVNFAGRVLAPKNAYAYDSGPEHFSIQFSHFDGVDVQSSPDLSVTALSSSADGAFAGDAVSVTYSVENRSRRAGGESTASSAATTAGIYLWSDAAMTQQVAGPLAAASAIPAMAPDAPAQTITQSVTLPANVPLDRQYYLGARVDPSQPLQEVDAPSFANNSRSTPLLLKDHPIALSVTSAEKLPGGSQHFAVQGGASGPYVWSVNGIDGGNDEFGRIVTNADYSADYAAPAVVPSPATFDVCARRQANTANRACAAVTIRPVPSSGADIVVFNDINIFDGSNGVANAPLFRNFANFTASGPRAANTKVLVYRGNGSICEQDTRFNPARQFCSPAQFAPLSNALVTAGFTVADETDQAARITTVPPDVKVILLVNPAVPFSNEQINGLKAFAGEGGRVIFVGEHFGYYGEFIGPVQNDFLAKMGAVMRNRGNVGGTGIYACPATVSGDDIRPHQITTDVSSVAFGCSSDLQLGPNDYALLTISEQSSLRVLAAIAKVDLTPLQVINRSLQRSSDLTGTSGAAPVVPPAGPEVPGWNPVP